MAGFGQHSSPRVSDANTETNPSTLYNDLHRLANIVPKPTTPYRRAASVGMTPRSASIRTPGTGRTPRGGPATRPLPARRVAPTTPHAIRALRERAQAARTPGHVRRRSGRVQRETPRDILRELSRVLAPTTVPTQSSPRTQTRPIRHSALDLPDLDDGPEPAPPRLSMRLDDMYDDEDSIHEPPPRQSLLPNLPDDVDNGTLQSLEFGRRALSEDPRMFHTRISGQFGDLNDLTINGESYELDGNFINRRQTMNPDDLQEQVPEEGLDDTTSEIRALTGRRDGRLGDIDLGVFGEMDDETEEPTFRFTIPQRMQAPTQEEVEEETLEQRDESLEALFENEAIEEDKEGESMAPEDIGNEEDKEEAPAMAADDDDPEEYENAGWESEPGDDDLINYREEVSAVDRSLQTQTPDPASVKKPAGRRKTFKEIPSLPTTTIKTLVTGFMKSQNGKARTSKDIVDALSIASDFFFEQVGDDLKAYAQHAGRTTIEESDVIAIMKRTRQITDHSTAFSLAQKLLPRELLQQLRMQPAPKLRGQKRKRMDTVHEEEDDD